MTCPGTSISWGLGSRGGYGYCCDHREHWLPQSPLSSICYARHAHSHPAKWVIASVQPWGQAQEGSRGRGSMQLVMGEGRETSTSKCLGPPQLWIPEGPWASVKEDRKCKAARRQAALSPIQRPRVVSSREKRPWDFELPSLSYVECPPPSTSLCKSLCVSFKAQLPL